MIIDGKMTNKMTMDNRVETIMIGIIHPGKIEIIDNLTGVVGIMMREGPMTRGGMKIINY